jgi:hypothetical protein
MNIGQNLKDRKVRFVYIIIPIAPYVIWVFATYVLEVSIYLLQRLDPIGRFTYVIIAVIAAILNILLLQTTSPFGLARSGTL